MTNPANPGNNAGPNSAVPSGTPPLNQPFDKSQISSTGFAADNTAINTAKAMASPPPMRTFVYAPEVRVVIAHGLTEIDVSADLVRCTLIRPENSAATFFFSLQNKNLRYTPPVGQPFFSRMDRIVVYMKKTAWIQVFAGYLDTIPYKAMYPNICEFKATCTIKRLMHTWWNPDLPQSSQILNQMNTALSLLGGDGQDGTDSGLGSVLRRLLVVVGGWSLADVHIQNFPEVFFQFLQDQILLQQSSNAPNLQNFKQMLLGSDTSPGPGAYAGSNPNAGVPGPTVGAAGGVGAAISGSDAQTSFYITQIVAACDALGMGPSTNTNNLSAGLQQAGTTGESSNDQADQKAWQQTQATATTLWQANRNSDAAILGVACAMAETGGGISIRNLANLAMPGSDQFPNDGYGTDGTSVGIFQQQNFAEWGNLSQRMNPRQAATMFFQALPAGWRGMDPGQAIQQAQRSANSAGSQYDAAVPLATTLVQSYRTAGLSNLGNAIPSASVGTSSPLAAASSGAAAAGLGGAPSATNGVLASSSNFPTPVVSAGGGANPLSSIGPQPNSEGAINFAMTQLGCPYVWGAKGPGAYDCSGLMNASFKAIGVAVPGQTDAIRASIPQVTPNSAVQRGDLVEPTTGHVVLWCGDGTIIEAPHSGAFVQRIPNPYGPPASWAWVGRACQNGGPNPAAPFNPPQTMGPGNPPSALIQQGGPGQTGSGGSAEAVARNLFSYQFSPDQFSAQVADFFTGDKAFIDGQPLLQMIQAVAAAGLRSWSSGPDGSFIAWYPDYFGVDGKPAVLQLANIELKDFRVDFSDDSLTTHVYINGDWSQLGDSDPVMGWIDTTGVATVEQQWLYSRLVMAAPGDMETMLGAEVMQRFGVRPLAQTYAMAGSHELEFLLACQTFMQKYAEQYQTEVTMTFMPELFPGMRVQLADQDLQVYVKSVTHTCDYERGFQTTAVIMAPSSPYARSKMLTVNTVYGPGPDQDTLRAFQDPFSNGGFK